MRVSLKKTKTNHLSFHSLLLKVSPHCVQDLAVVISGKFCGFCSHVLLALSISIHVALLALQANKTQDRHCPHFTDGDNGVQGAYMRVQGLLGTHCESQP